MVAQHQTLLLGERQQVSDSPKVPIVRIKLDHCLATHTLRTEVHFFNFGPTPRGMSRDDLAMIDRGKAGRDRLHPVRTPVDP